METSGRVGGRVVPSILHVDMDAFYAAIEQAHKPSLRGKPVVVGGIGPRGVVSTASYEARAYGVRSAIPTSVARRRCPNAAYLSPRFGAYHVVSETVMGMLRELSPLVEPLSLDEAFIDLAAMPSGAPGSIDEVRAIAEDLRARIAAATGLTASVGAGGSKLIAKVASDADKPDGLVIVAPGVEQEWLDPLPVRALWGVGPATAERLRAVGVTTVAELRAQTEPELVRLIGKSHGGSLHALARGLDSRPVESSRELKQISVEDTFAVDIIDEAVVRGELERLVSRLVTRLHGSGRSGRTITVKVRGHDFTTITRSETLPAPTDADGAVRAVALRLLTQAVQAMPGGIRLLGVGVSGLADFAQHDLFTGDDPEPPAPDDAGDAADATGAAEVAGAADAPRLRPTVFGPLPASRWRPGQDVVHAEHGPGWVQGSGLGRVTVRFETPRSGPGRIRTLPADDPALTLGDDADVARGYLRALA